MDLQYLVTGTGRCGTVSMARLLTLQGKPCGHEMLFTYHGLEMAKKRLAGQAPLRLSQVSTTKFTPNGTEPVEDWLGEWLNQPEKIIGESSYMAAPFLLDPIFDDVQIIHVVRDPIKVITSFCRYLNYFGSTESLYEQFIYSHFPELRQYDDQIARATKYYILWNEMIERNAQGHPYKRYQIEDEQALNNSSMPKDINSFEKKGVNKLSWLSIPDEVRPGLETIAERYGYTIC